MLHQRGEIKVGRWQRFEADWVLAPPEGFIWAATTHLGPLFIRGFDRYTPRVRADERGASSAGSPFLSADGPDVDRSALGRLVGELCFVPAAALSPLVRWEHLDDRRSVACVDAGGRTHRVTLTVAASGRLERLDLLRWGNPDGREFREHTFTALMDGAGGRRSTGSPIPLGVPGRVVALPGPLRERGVHPVHRSIAPTIADGHPRHRQAGAGPTAGHAAA